MSITIKKAKLKGRKIALKYLMPVEGGVDTIDNTCANQVHKDLLKAVEKLVPHFILLCELPEATALKLDLRTKNMDDIIASEFPKIQVTGFAVGGDDDGEGLTIIGCRLLDSGKQLNVNSPFIQYSSEDYEYIGDLSLTMQEIESEINEFLNGKISNKQLDMFDDTNANADDPFAEVEISVTPTEKPKKKGRKKKAKIETEPIPAA